jgi:hypothetical protein
MLIGALTAGFAHGLMVIAAPESKDSHDDWEPSRQPVHAGPDSMYIGVQSSASGLVSIECHDASGPEAGLVPLYLGQLSVPSSKFIIYDPNATFLLTVLTESERTSVALFGDSNDDPRRLVLLVDVRVPID